jgi:hypothetical protein
MKKATATSQGNIRFTAWAVALGWFNKIGSN